ncbi:MAG TPA: AMP-binding protein [Longimicrobiaceae bacterium]|nr:AMP-binding protein [Longimicrobiaceae bacterium]
MNRPSPLHPAGIAVPRPALAEGPPLPDEAAGPRRLAEVIHRAARHASPRDVVLLRADGSESAWSYADLLARAERVNGGLRRRGLVPGDRVVFQLARGDELLAAFWGCVLGGFAAVPLAPAPGYRRENGVLRVLRGTPGWSGRTFVLASGELAPGVRGVDARLRVLDLDEVEEGAPDPEWHPSRPEDPALFLLSSGSTGEPKRITRTHGNVLSTGARAVWGGAVPDRDKVSLHWLPLDHNAGLMAMIGNTASVSRQVLLPTETVLRDPLAWLDHVSRYRATHTAASNFLLGLVDGRADEVRGRGWDLGCVRHVGVTGEAVVPRTARSFLRLLAPYGLDGRVLRPAYGMSEAGAIARADDFALHTTSDEDRFVRVGRPYPGVSIRVVDAGGALLPEHTPGRVQVRGSAVTPGYDGRPELTREVLTEDGWLDTGDLGVLADGALTLTGREKEVIIVNGVNFHAHEVEAVVEAVDGVERSYTAACATRAASDDTDTLAVFFHTPRTGSALAELLRALRRRIAGELGIDAGHLVPVEKDEVPKTGTGKIRRAELRRQLEEGAFDARLQAVEPAAGADEPAADPPRTAVETQIAALWREVLGVERVGRSDDFFELGGHSLPAGALVARLRAVYGVDLSIRTLFEAPTVAALAVEVARAQGAREEQERLARLLDEMEGLSDEEVLALLDAAQ